MIVVIVDVDIVRFYGRALKIHTLYSAFLVPLWYKNDMSHSIDFLEKKGRNISAAEYASMCLSENIKTYKWNYITNNIHTENNPSKLDTCLEKDIPSSWKIW